MIGPGLAPAGLLGALARMHQDDYRWIALTATLDPPMLATPGPSMSYICISICISLMMVRKTSQEWECRWARRVRRQIEARQCAL